MRTVVVPETFAERQAATELAERLGLPCLPASGPVPAGDVALHVGHNGLTLRSGAGVAVRAEPGALRGDARPGRDGLGRAVGRLSTDGFVLDATAGLGKDGFWLAARGHRVTLVERVPAIAALLEDALARARLGEAGEAAAAAAGRVQLLCGDAVAVMAGLPAPPEVVTIDPMYPERSKSALPNKGMALFRALIGEDHDADRLLLSARQVALQRVVVKRPLRAAHLGGQRPSGSIRGSTTRWDIYPTTPGSAAARPGARSPGGGSA